jgi:iron complex outermembrane receptor protein
MAREIEIVRGPAALLYGSNALGGVVNVISDDIPRVGPMRRTVTLSLTGESVTSGAGTLLDVEQPLGSATAATVKVGGLSHDDMSLPQDGSQANTSARNRTVVAGVGHVANDASGGIAYRRYAFEYGLPYRDDPSAGVRLRGLRHDVTARAQSALPAGPIARVRVEASTQWYDHDEVLTTGDVATALGLDTRQVQVVASTRDAGAWRGGAIGLTWSGRHNGVAGAQALTPPNDGSASGLTVFQELVPRGWPRVRVPMAARLERTRMTSRDTPTFGPAIERSFTAWSASFTLFDVPCGVRIDAGPSTQHLMLRLDNATDRLTRDATSRVKDFAPNPGRNAALTYRIAF